MITMFALLVMFGVFTSYVGYCVGRETGIEEGLQRLEGTCRNSFQKQPERGNCIVH